MCLSLVHDFYIIVHTQVKKTDSFKVLKTDVIQSLCAQVIRCTVTPLTKLKCLHDETQTVINPGKLHSLCIAALEKALPISDHQQRTHKRLHVLVLLIVLWISLMSLHSPLG